MRRISQLDVSAGYDIESFNGSIGASLEYDRFIEVKASQDPDLRFYWTANERRTAQRLGTEYWIYFIGSFGGKATPEIAPIMIRNPIVRLEQIAELTIEPSAYLVAQVGPLSLTPADLERSKGYLL